MTNNLRTIKTSLLLGLILISLFATIVPITSAGLIFNLQSYVEVSWIGNETQEPIIPRGELRQLDLNVMYGVTRGAFGRLALEVYRNRLAVIQIEIIDTPEWATANIASGTLQTTIIPDQTQMVSTIVSLQVDENAPAYALGYVTIKASVEKAGLIQGFEQTFTLNFVAAYKPLIKPSLPKSNAKEIGPLDTATFPIEIENLGNARTVVLLDVVDVPKDWNAVITSQVILEEGEGSKATAYLVVKPPKGFGYHFDEKTIKISMLPVRADDFSQQGTMIYETFLVQSRGFSTPGFEAIIFIGALFAIILLIKVKRKK